MIIPIIILLFALCLYLFLPYIDSYTDYRGKKHIVIWYTFNGERKFINLIGSQE